MGKSSKQRHRRDERRDKPPKAPKKPPKQHYVVAIGSNQPLSRRLAPRAIVAAAMLALDTGPVRVRAIAPIVRSRPLGPSARDYANSAVVLRTRLSPPDLLDHLQRLEARFGRRRRVHWGSRTLDLDIILWEGGTLLSPRLTIPHPALHARDFVLKPVRAITPQWRDPISGLAIAHLAARNARPKPVAPKAG